MAALRDVYPRALSYPHYSMSTSTQYSIAVHLVPTTLQVRAYNTVDTFSSSLYKPPLIITFPSLRFPLLKQPYILPS